MTSPSQPASGRRSTEFVRDLLAGGGVRTTLAIILGFAVGSAFMVFSDEGVQVALGYFFARPSDFFVAAGSVLQVASEAIFRGAIFNQNADTLALGLKSLTETLRFGAPLIAAGLGIALGFRVGLFNIGGTGQLVFGAAISGWVSFKLPLPGGIHLVVAIIAGILAAALWGAIAGFLKARTGAHEVILTIMLNYIGINLVTWMLRDPAILQDPTVGAAPRSLPPLETAQMPLLLGPDYALHAGFILVVAATVLYWWLMERSVLGFKLRMVGYNPHAARTAGINIDNVYFLTMALSAGFVGIAAVNQSLGRDSGFTSGVHSGIGFDAITVALLGAGTPWGVFFAGLLFGAFKAAAPAMQVAGIAPEVLGIVQGAIVLFIAAPPLIRAIFRLPKERASRARSMTTKAEEAP